MGKNSLTGTSFGCRLWARKAQGLSAVTSEATALGPDLCPTAASQAQRSNGLSLCLLGWGLLGLEAAALGQQISILGTPGSPGTHGWRTRISGRGLGRTGEPHGAPRGQEGPGAQACLTWTTPIPAPAFIELSCVQQPSPHPEWEALPLCTWGDRLGWGELPRAADGKWQSGNSTPASGAPSVWGRKWLPEGALPPSDEGTG